MRGELPSFFPSPTLSHSPIYSILSRAGGVAGGLEWENRTMGQMGGVSLSSSPHTLSFSHLSYSPAQAARQRRAHPTSGNRSSRR